MKNASDLPLSTLPMNSWAVLFVGTVFFSGCDQSPGAQVRHAADATSFRYLPLSQVDLGATLLAEVENARVAIVAGNSVAASNDVAQALSFGTQLLDRPSNLIRSGSVSNERDRTSGPRGTRRDGAALTVFGVQVELHSAQADLPGNLAGADAHLRNIQNGILQGSIPTDLPLLRVAASLDLAQVAATEGRHRDLRTQLLSAQIALQAYNGPGHLADASALQETIDQSLGTGSADAMLSYQPSSWLFTVLAWSGTNSWNASIR